MRRLQRALTIALLCLLAWVATASAECAWVLWEHRVTPSASGTAEAWLPQEATEKRADCDTKIETLIQRLVQPRTSGSLRNYERTGDSKGVTMYQGRKDQGAYQTSDFRCLPDTVDPRGPKTK